jgi:hypothetical protein
MHINFVRRFAAFELHLECDTLWTFHQDRSPLHKSDDAELRNMLWTSAPFFRRIMQVYIYGGAGVVVNMQESVDVRNSNFAKRTQLRKTPSRGGNAHNWEFTCEITIITGLPNLRERFHSFSVGSPSPPTHPLDLSSWTLCTFTHKWRPWNWLLTIHGHSEPAPNRGTTH